MSSFDPQFHPTFGRLGWTQGVENSTNGNLIPTFLFSFYIHQRPILHRLTTIHNVAYRDRETDRAMEIGRLCYSIGGLMTTIPVDYVLTFNNQMAKIIELSIIIQIVTNSSFTGPIWVTLGSLKLPQRALQLSPTNRKS